MEDDKSVGQDIRRNPLVCKTWTSDLAASSSLDLWSSFWVWVVLVAEIVVMVVLVGASSCCMCGSSMRGMSGEGDEKRVGSEGVILRLGTVRTEVMKSGKRTRCIDKS